MTDTLARLTEAEQAKAAWERFMGPAIKSVRQIYLDRLVAASGDVPNNGNRDIIAHSGQMLRLLDQVGGQLAAVMLDGQVARSEMTRETRLSEMDPERRKWATM